jgi:hypothetical protein
MMPAHGARAGRVSAEARAIERTARRPACRGRGVLPSTPYALIGSFDDASTEYVFRARVFENPPRRFGVLIGDVLHNMRSALDHLAWQLVLLNGSQPGRATAFPILDSPADYQRAAPRMLAGIAPSHAAEIKSVPPFNSPFGSADVLSVVRDLSNSDKHRVLATTIGWAEHLQPVFYPDGRSWIRTTDLRLIRAAL